MRQRQSTVKWIGLSVFSLLLICYGAGTGSQTAAASQVADDPAAEQPASWYAIQVGSFPRLSLAEKEISTLQKKGLDTFYRYEDTGGKGMWYRVYIGGYPTYEAAKASAEELVQQGEKVGV